MMAVRRTLAGLVLAVTVLVPLSGSPAQAETPAPTPIMATASATAPTELPDVAPDNSRQLWVVGGAALIAVIAAATVLLRRS